MMTAESMLSKRPVLRFSLLRLYFSSIIFVPYLVYSEEYSNISGLTFVEIKVSFTDCFWIVSILGDSTVGVGLIIGATIAVL